MKYGHFDDLQREYVINTPETPSPWINYLGSEQFFSLFSHTGRRVLFLSRCTASSFAALPLQRHPCRR